MRFCFQLLFFVDVWNVLDEVAADVDDDDDDDIGNIDDVVDVVEDDADADDDNGIDEVDGAHSRYDANAAVDFFLLLLLLFLVFRLSVLL